MYVPRKNIPDETFLSPEVQMMLADKDRHKEINEQYSLQQLEDVARCTSISLQMAPLPQQEVPDNVTTSTHILCIS